MKKLLIISPHFPPVNAADMHRVRQMLPYLNENGWEAEVVAVDPAFIESYSTDDLLLKTIPAEIKVHYVKAWSVTKTRKFGLGSLSMRSYFFYKKKVNELLSSGKFDLIFFSTTAFHVMALGPYWKKKFNVPFVLDIQDPWRNDFYLNKPAKERPPKFWIAYTIDKYLEARTIPRADGIISVSKGYCDEFQRRYQTPSHLFTILPFAAVPADFETMKSNVFSAGKIQLEKQMINVVYVGRGGHDMKLALQIFFSAFAKGLQENKNLFSLVHCWFIGTSYAKEGQGEKTIQPIAEQEGVENYVTEITDRIPYFETLFLLQKADVLFVPGSTDTSYTASKIYPYILAEKPLLAIFHQSSSVVEILKQSQYGSVITFNSIESASDELITATYKELVYLISSRNEAHTYDKKNFEKFTAKQMTKTAAAVFDRIIKKSLP